MFNEGFTDSQNVVISTSTSVAAAQRIFFTSVYLQQFIGFVQAKLGDLTFNSNKGVITSNT